MKLLDAQAALSFLVNQLSYVEPELYRIRYPSFDFASLVPVDTSAPEWIKMIEFFSIDTVGQAKWQAGGADDIPKADIVRDRGSHSIYLAAIGYGYTLEELSTAQYMGFQLTTEKGDAAQRAYNIFMYNVAIFGDTEKNLKGIANQSSVTAGNVAADGTGSSTYWVDKTPTQIIRDLNDLVSGVNTDSNGVEWADTILLPYSAFWYIASTLMSSGSDTTILSFFMENNALTRTTGRRLVIQPLRGLENAAASNKGRAVAYQRDPSVLKLHLPMPHRFLPPFQTGPLRWDIPGIFRTGGVEVRRPGSMRYADLITA